MPIKINMIDLLRILIQIYLSDILADEVRASGIARPIINKKFGKI